MKYKILSILILISALTFISACTPFGFLSPDDDLERVNDVDNQNSKIIDNDINNSESDISNAPIQRWREDEFRRNEEDILFFTPKTNDYMLTETYLNTQPDSSVIYTLTILRSFDETGKVISQFQKYSFDIPFNAEYAYDIFIQDGNNYPSLVCVGYAVILEQTADVVEGQRTKEQFVNDYNEDGITKYWLSKP